MSTEEAPTVAAGAPCALRLSALGWVRAMNPGSEGGGSQPHLFETTGGPYMVKVVNNPQGARVFPNELIAGLCLDWIGVRHPSPAIIDVPQEVIDDSPEAKFADGTALASGLAFGSEYWQSDAQGTIPPDRLINVEDVAGVMALDTWINNHDSRQYRTRPAVQQPGKYDFFPVDQGHCFGNPAWTAQTLSTSRAVTVPVPVIPVETAAVKPFTKRLRTFTPLIARSLVSEVPDGWITQEEREAVAAYLGERALLAADALADQYGIGESDD